MTYCCITCEFDKARANNAPGRRNLRPMIPPVAVTRDTAAGATSPREAASPRLVTLMTESQRESAAWGDVPHAQPSVAGPSSSSVGGETPSELATPVGLGGQGPTLDTYPRAGSNTTGVSGLAVRHEADVDLVVMTSECSEPRLGAVS